MSRLRAWGSELREEFRWWGFWVTKPYNLMGWSHWMQCRCCCHLLLKTKQVSSWEMSVNYQALRCHNHSLNLCTRENLKNKPQTLNINKCDTKKKPQYTFLNCLKPQILADDALKPAINVSGVFFWSFRVNKIESLFNPLKTKRRPLYLKTQSVPRCKHFSSRL